jgi:hypothetical protein
MAMVAGSYSVQAVDCQPPPVPLNIACKTLLETVVADKEILKAIEVSLCKKPAPQSLNDKRIFCAKLAFAGDFFEIPINYEKLPGSFCGQVRLHKTDTSRIVELPNLVNFPGCPCV